ncbi:tRNA uracil 4-sulfurtransferase ThiI [Streptomyces sp. TP-A0874]|uniref:tRNA uracil 4-sulfurtransferase ThiI n=1 Tax=Streptomyces sp. TP-A0874 TaxID=549819 RepID=UPI0009A08497|nr:tRNA uracil 4-sulfurtransferase ThiI [Streptomyces sp. TP-A0874]
MPAPSASGSEQRPTVRPGECVLLKHGEVFLKGRNRHLFIERLHDNLRDALRGVGGSTWIKNSGNVTVLGGEVEREKLVERARRVIGFNALLPAVRVPSTVEDIASAAIAALSETSARRPEASFAVRVRRRDKTFPLTSSEFERELGARIQRRLGLPVNLSSPDVPVAVEIDHRESYVSCERLAGRSGLPVGSSGRALVLLSGGYDSPVAAYRAMRRGLRCDFVHFTGAPYTDAASLYKAYALVRELNRYQPGGRLHVVPLGKAQKQLSVAGAGKFQVVGQRRLMVRTASALARRLRAEALVTGDSLGQVASQTLTNMATVDEAASLPVLRPLIGWEKQEIIDEARAIGTAEISVLPDEDCCQLLAPERASTRAYVSHMERFEKRLDMDEIVEGLLAKVQCLRPGDDRPEDAPPPRSARVPAQHQGTGASACDSGLG